MQPVRHSCGERLFDSSYEVVVVQDGILCDFSVRCRKCKVTVRYQFALPRWKKVGHPEPVLCNCGKRLLDVQLVYEMTDGQNGDLAIQCKGKNCRAIPSLRFGGVIRVS